MLSLSVSPPLLRCCRSWATTTRTSLDFASPRKRLPQAPPSKHVQLRVAAPQLVVGPRPLPLREATWTRLTCLWAVCGRRMGEAHPWTGSSRPGLRLTQHGHTRGIVWRRWELFHTFWCLGVCIWVLGGGLLDTFWYQSTFRGRSGLLLWWSTHLSDYPRNANRQHRSKEHLYLS